MTHQPAVQATTLAKTKDRGADARRIVLIGPEYWCAKREKQSWQHHVIFDDDTLPAAKGGGKRHVRERRLSFPRRYLCEMLCDEPPRFGRIEVAGNGKDGIVGRVVRREEMLDVVEACCVEIRHRADERMMKRVLLGKCQRW